MSLPFGQEDSSSDLHSEPPGLKTWQTVHIRNTFIEVDESTEPRADPAVTSSSTGSTLGRTWRRGHLRCASEPMSSFFARSPWEPMSLATSPLDALPGAALQADALGTVLDSHLGPSRHAPSNPERGRVSTSLGATLMRSPRAQSYVTPIRESDEYEALRRIHFPKYIDINTDFMGQSPWHEPMMVDVDTQERKDPYRHTLAVPVRSYRHARQRSRTIQEDKELVDSQTYDLAEAQPLASQSSWDNVGNVNFRVRNTFIEVDETGSESCADLLSPPHMRWRPSHLRCASEPVPVQSFEGFRSAVHSGSGFHSRTSSYQAEEPLDMQAMLQAPAREHEAKASPERQERAELRNANLNSKDAFKESHSRECTGAAVKTQCKWHLRGTCKYGAACRFSHDRSQKPSASSELQKAPGPLPAGLVPGPLPVGPHAPEAKPQTPGPLPRPSEHTASRCRSASPVSTTAGSSAGEEPGAGQRPGQSEKPHQVFWCDARAFKQEFQGLREQLETSIGMAAKSHKTAEKCMRLLKKKQRVRAERGRGVQKARPLVFLVSWANAQELVGFLQEAAHMPPLKVVVLCDTNGARTRAAAERWSKDISLIEHVAATWPEAVQVVSDLLSKSISTA